MKNFLIDFGFEAAPTDDVFEQAEYGGQGGTDKSMRVPGSPRKQTNRQVLLWTLLIYVFLCLGILLRRAVQFPEPLHGVNTSVFTGSIIAASFIIGLAVLAPLLRVISKYHKKQLSWSHGLTAFSIGFFGDMTFTLIINGFAKVLA